MAIRLNKKAFTDFVTSDSSEDIKTVDDYLDEQDIEFESRKQGFKALCILLGVKTPEDLDKHSYVINTVLKNRGLGKDS